MTAQRQQVPAIEGWFTLDGDAPVLVGATCSTCATVVFPPRTGWCPNPACDGTELAPTELGRTGRIWSYSTNHYAPPAPYIAPDPFEPYTVAAVELTEQRLVVLGQMAPEVDPADLCVGQEVELTIGTLYSEGDTDHVMWHWRPVAAR